MSSLRAKCLFTAFVWCRASIMIALQVMGWIAGGVRGWGFAVVVVLLAIGATLQGWLAELQYERPLEDVAKLDILRNVMRHTLRLKELRSPLR